MLLPRGVRVGPQRATAVPQARAESTLVPFLGSRVPPWGREHSPRRSARRGEPSPSDGSSETEVRLRAALRAQVRFLHEPWCRILCPCHLPYSIVWTVRRGSPGRWLAKLDSR